MHILIENDEELERLHIKGEGFIYNDYGGKGSRDGRSNILHIAGCHSVNRAKADIKLEKHFFDTHEEAVVWLNEKRGIEGKGWRKCKYTKCKNAMPEIKSYQYSQFLVSSAEASAILEEVTINDISSNMDLFSEITGFEDARKRVLSSIAMRQGQSVFRKNLLSAYQNTCVVTGCMVSAVLDAAHIHPYMGEHTNIIQNGLLMRTDIHALFDLGLIRIDPNTRIINIASYLEKTEYADLNGRKLTSPKCSEDAPTTEILKWHWNFCKNQF